MAIEIDHRPAAHCETGVTAGLLRQRGLELSEPMVLGIGSGLFFAYLPWVTFQGCPVVAYRDQNGLIFKRVTRALGVTTRRERFRDPAAATVALDARLATGQPVGVQAGIYWLPYFPPHLRAHFNMHNVLVYAREGEDYLVSDVVLPEVSRIAVADLERARFATGEMRPRGAMYYLTGAPAELPDLRPAVLKGIRTTCFRLLSIPLPWFGLSAIALFARHLRRWPERLGVEVARHRLTSLVRLQEETGTGGAGFRFMYAAFLAEAAELLEDEELAAFAPAMNAIGDRWRDYAAMAARLCKDRGETGDSYDALAGIVVDCGRRERDLFSRLRAWGKGRR